ncbi:D-serine dehydratase [Aspergillus terreus]|uniref:D-serine dehydratase n=1 Tax=Aspergillus terreus TaxID=33178 RepID=A0A5M3YRK8_ASPTE|nr:hypothetical protein ATETN484_0003035400 [Aspergillus terreus]GFF14343.1 D-serine dehydratase [Aspergillus terreus]
MALNDFPSRPLPSADELRRFYIGKDIKDVPKPAAVLDLAIVSRHCQAMLSAVKHLNVGFRAHIKTHKTLQLSEWQVGTSPGDEANFVVSTLAEAELLLPLLKVLRRDGRKVNVLYGIPLVPSQVPRLATVAREVGESSVSVMIDHPDQLVYLSQFREIAGFAAGVFLKVDTGYHRAGVPPTMLNKNGLLEKIAEEEKAGRVVLLGVYSHSSLSYAATNAEEAMSYLKTEIAGCKEALQKNSHLLPTDRELVISVGATPQAISAHNLLQEPLGPEAKNLQTFMQSTAQDTGARVKIELHAGVYSVMDMQQMATRAKHLGNIEDEVALSVIAEVCSVYNNGERDKPEALVAAGNLEQQPGAPRLIVERISQEHGIVSWHGGDGPEVPLRVGQSLRIYPNHACITGALYGWYLTVDSSRKGEETKIVDVWVRVNGWERIYRHALVTPRIFVRPFITVAYLNDQNRTSRYGILTLSLLRASKQVYSEAMPIYLRENTFSIVQVDVLAAAGRESPRVLYNLRQIRKVEVVFDSRDYIYMAHFLADVLPAVVDVMDHLTTTASESTPTAVDGLRAMHLDFESEEDDPAHGQHIENMNEYLWGRTLTFLRQTFKLPHLYVDLTRCTCVDGCCRLADEVLGWGCLQVWTRGIPKVIQVKGTSSREKTAVARILDQQRLHQGFSLENVVDSDRLTDVRTLGEYNDMLREVHLKIDHIYVDGAETEEAIEAD